MHQQVWNGTFFDKTMLQTLGLCVQLGHGGGSCSSPQAAHSSFMVINTTGIHSVLVDFCDCRQDGVNHRRTQLLCVAWFSMTFDRPRTVFMFDVLETFHELTLQCKTTLYDFYYMILRKTDIHKFRKAMVSKIVVLFNFSFQVIDSSD
jgi:CxC2 like cysteine cluster associated with KDZ transposases